VNKQPSANSYFNKQYIWDMTNVIGSQNAELDDVNWERVALGGLVVNVLATGPKVRSQPRAMDF
jgi:type IV secretory pathway TrbF-like protein